MSKLSFAAPSLRLFPGGHAPTFSVPAMVWVLSMRGQDTSAPSLPSGLMGNEERGYTPMPTYAIPIYRPRRWAWTGQEDASPVPSPRSVDYVEPSSAFPHPIGRQDRNEWLWTRRPSVFVVYRALRKSRSCPDRLLAHYD